MPSNWFRGGLDAVNNAANAWNIATDLRCSAVAGTGIVSSNRYWQTLDDFLQSNTLIGDEASVPDPPNRGISWVGENNRYDYWFTDPLSFGVIAAGQEIAGVVFYDGDRDIPGSAALWLCSENSGGFFTVPPDGGIVSVGTSLDNIAASWTCLAISNRFTFQGTLDLHTVQADPWGDSGWRIGYALVRDTTTATITHEWRLMSDLPAGVIYCSGGEPGAANQPESQLASREGPAIALNADGDYYEWGIKGVSAGRTPITWPIADLTPGEVVTAVIAFAYQGVYSAATARIIHWDDVANHTIQAAQNVTYAQVGAVSINQMSI